MNQLNDIKKLIPPVLKGGDILLIVPPFGRREYSVLGPHILQSIAERIGYKTDILYANILFVSIVGENIYDKISNLPYNIEWMKLGERLFARSAYGLTGFNKFTELQSKGDMHIPGNMHPPVKTLQEIIDFHALANLEEMCFSFVDEIVQVITSMNYKIIGCTSMQEQNNSSVAILKRTKNIQPDTTTLMGGINCEGEMAEGIASLSDAIDYIFSGESEDSFEKFLKGYSKGELPSKRVVTGNLLKDLNTLPLPDYESYFSQTRQFLQENKPNNMILSYETSRGCRKAQKGRCFFCGGIRNFDRFRLKSEEKVEEDLDRIADSYPVNAILMTDNMVPRFFYKKILPFLSGEKEYPRIWYQENTNLKLSDLINLKKARINSLLLGIEALSTNLLKLMNKGVTARQNLLLLRNARSVGMHCSWHMLWGFPGDKIAHYEETLRLLPLIRHLQPPAEFLSLKLSRYSSYVMNPHYHRVENLRPLEVYRKIYPDWADIDRLGCYFTGDYPCEALDNPGLIQELADEVELWKKTFMEAKLVMIPSADYYIVYDGRLPGKEKSHILIAPQAKETMAYGKYNESEYQEWSLEQKLGVVVDSWYVPLVTASPDLLLEFES